VGVAQVIEYLPSKYKVLSLNPSAAKTTIERKNVALKNMISNSLYLGTLEELLESIWFYSLIL
jgi:hypothetical protein